ncbi:MAG: 16S rRNA (uracil(1498)-N(3))-methyltransferase [Oscillospiraceae bacterium]|jgi:16S rRNA (uracil1498-N3)-methyltransferase|nr:16S rRNA (uracil(1498)-N(3))-methyltransferase [Oscillospiraceae bacterium]
MIQNGNDEKYFRLPRFFGDVTADRATLTGDDCKHIVNVLRLTAGKRVIICDNLVDFTAEIIAISSGSVELEVIRQTPNKAELPTRVRLFQCLPKGDKLDFITQKATELGVTEIIPVLSKRCVSRPDDKSMRCKLVRLNRVAYEAAKQSGRGVVPRVLPLIAFSEAAAMLNAETDGLFFYEGGGEKPSAVITAGRNIDVFIGCEGGFSDEEVQLATSKGWRTCTLGNRILRCETAPIAALAVIADCIS